MGRWTTNTSCAEVCIHFVNEENVADKVKTLKNGSSSLFGSTSHSICTCSNNSSVEIRNNISNDTPDDIIDENAKVGLLFSSKAFVQLITNSFMGTIINR